MSFEEPKAVEEAKPRTITYLLAAAVSILIFAAIAALYYRDQGQPVMIEEELLHDALRAGAPEFDQYREQIKIEAASAMESFSHSGDITTELTAIVKNSTDRTISGLEMRGAVVDAQGSTVRERTVVIIPMRQVSLKPDEITAVRIIVEGIKLEADRSNICVEVTGIHVE
jgi:hypothetical protein